VDRLQNKRDGSSPIHPLTIKETFCQWCGDYHATNSCRKKPVQNEPYPSSTAFRRNPGIPWYRAPFQGTFSYPPIAGIVPLSRKSAYRPGTLNTRVRQAKLEASMKPRPKYSSFTMAILCWIAHLRFYRLGNAKRVPSQANTRTISMIANLLNPFSMGLRAGRPAKTIFWQFRSRSTIRYLLQSWEIGTVLQPVAWNTNESAFVFDGAGDSARRYGVNLGVLRASALRLRAALRSTV